MGDNTSRTQQPTGFAGGPSSQAPVPGTRAAAMAAAAAALRAAAGDMEDPRTTPLPGVQLSRRQLEVASWLRRRADLLEPEPATAWQRNKLVGVSMLDPELSPANAQAVVELAEEVARNAARFGLTYDELPHLLSDLVAAFRARQDAA